MRRKKRDLRMRPILTIIALICLASCSGRAESTVAENAAKAKISDNLPGTNLEFAEFEKLDGLASVKDGIERYEFDFLLAVRLPDGYNPACVGHEQDPSCYFALHQFIKPVRAGRMVCFEGMASLLKKENGWISEDVSITKATAPILIDICYK